MISDYQRAPSWLGKTGLHHLWTSRSGAKAIQKSTDGSLFITNGTLGYGISSSIPRIHVFHGTMVEAMRCTKGLSRSRRLREGIGGALAEKFSVREATTVAVSKSAALEVKRYYGIKVDHVIENGVDTDHFKPRDQSEARSRFNLQDSEKYALFVGRAEPRKGINLALEASGKAGYKLLVAGSRDVSGAINLGSLDYESLPWAYNAANCVIMPTSYEACSYVVLEALASATPLITTKVGWMRDFVSAIPNYSMLMPELTVNDFANTLIAMEGFSKEALCETSRNFVRENNDLSQFRTRWRSLVEDMV